MAKWREVALYKLATCAVYRVVAETFGTSETTAHRCVYVVCRAIRFKLLNKFVNLPDVSEAQAVAHRNSTKHLGPQLYGTLDGTHYTVYGYRD